MDFQVGDQVITPKGNGYINDIIGNQVIIDLVDGEHQREMFSINVITLLEA